MGLMRSVLLAASENQWLRKQAPQFGFVRRTVSRFMPGERLEDAAAAAESLRRNGLRSIFTPLGENVADRSQAEAAAQEYIDAVVQIRALQLPGAVSLKLTHLGLDFDSEFCFAQLERVLEAAETKIPVWIDMESSAYVDRTLDLFRRARARQCNVGVCVQSYLFRTQDDLESLLPLGAAIRLVKGAYREPANIAFPRKRDVDHNFFALTERLFSDQARASGVWPCIGTHDLDLIARVKQLVAGRGVAKDAFEFAMLYGIQRPAQLQLAQEGFNSSVLISYGDYWYAWFMRRLAERPANLLFAARNMLSG